MDFDMLTGQLTTWIGGRCIHWCTNGVWLNINFVHFFTDFLLFSMVTIILNPLTVWFSCLHAHIPLPQTVSETFTKIKLIISILHATLSLCQKWFVKVYLVQITKSLCLVSHIFVNVHVMATKKVDFQLPKNNGEIITLCNKFERDPKLVSTI